MVEKRVKESEIIKPALRIIMDKPGINTSQLIKELQNIVELHPGDKEILNNRKDTKFTQIVRNLISHRGNNKFGKCIYSKQEGKNVGFYINEKGKEEIRGYERKEAREEREDIDLQRRIRESNIYTDREELEKANSRMPEKNSRSNNAKYKMDARISKTVLKENEYVCEIERITGKKHETFITNRGKPYMEGHHLIPMKAQKDFENNIDRSENICCLCPNCHRAIHYGSIDEKKERLTLLYNEKIEKLKKMVLI